MNTKNLSLAIVATITLSLTSCGNKSEKETSLEEATSEYETPISETDKITDEPTEDVSKETEEDVTTTKGSNDIDAYLKSYE
jgi:predicted small lipoprotein YifL